MESTNHKPQYWIGREITSHKSQHSGGGTQRMRKLRIARLHNATLSQTLIFPCGLGKHCTSTEYVQMLPVTVNYYLFAYHYNCVKCCKSQEDRSRIIQEQVQGISANTTASRVTVHQRPEGNLVQQHSVALLVQTSRVRP